MGTITKIPTSGMTEADWLAQREQTIGGSEIGAILGLNPYKSAYTLWCERTGRLPRFEGNLRTQVGEYLEDLVARIFMETTGLKVQRTNFLWYNDDFPALHALPDRLLVGSPAGLEIKTTSAFNAGLFHGEVFPAQYYAQAVQYMAVMDYQDWYIAVLIGNHAFKIYRLTRQEGTVNPDWCEATLYVEPGEIEALNAAAEDFLRCVRENTPPPMDGSESTSETLETIYADANGGSIELFGRESALADYLQVCGEIKALEKRKQELANIFKSDLGDCETGLCDGHRITWRTQTRTSFDSKAALADHPELSAYQKSTTSRVFTVK